MRYLPVVGLLLFLRASLGEVNFPYETDVLTEADVVGKPNLRFGDVQAKASGDRSECKTYPGDPSWPSDKDWKSFNTSVGGALIKSIPPYAPCHNSSYGPYDQAECAYIQAHYLNSTYHMDQPVSIMAGWAEGNTCPAYDYPSCTLGGYPSYVVNVTTVKQIQLAVNFARNNNIRLVIKNTGHDFNGKSCGAGALSVWTHHLKAFEYLPHYSIGNYSGQAARVGSAIQAFELYEYMDQYNITMVAPGGTTVGVYGGYSQGGGHSVVAPLFGLGADQLLSLQVVTADGRFVTADPNQNSDLFWAIRGGGASTFGIVTSAVAKAHPSFPMSSFSVFFDTGLNTSTISTDALWQAFRAYCNQKLRLADVKAFTLWLLQSPVPPNGPFSKRQETKSYEFLLAIQIPYMNSTEAGDYLGDFIAELQALGIPTSKDSITTDRSYAANTLDRIRSSGLGEGAVGGSQGGARYISRLFPRENFVPGTKLFNDTFDAIRNVVDAQYSIIGDALAPTLEVAGYPDNAVNPAWRNAVLHATATDTLPRNYTVSELLARHTRMNDLIQTWRDLSPGSGSYLNEADIQEPNWQQSFYGSNYPRLLKVKQKWDPHEVFYMTTGVGSEGWEVRAPGGGPTQNGRLCRVQD